MLGEQIRPNGLSQKASARMIKALASRQQERERIAQVKFSLYSDWKNGDIRREEYASLKAKFERQLGELDAIIQRLEQETTTATSSSGI